MDAHIIDWFIRLLPGSYGKIMFRGEGGTGGLLGTMGGDDTAKAG